MVAEDGFVVTGGNGFANLDEIMLNVLNKSVRDAANFLAERAKPNAPIDSGDLRASIRGEMVSSEGGVFEARIVADEDYALRMHEELTPFGPLNLGPGSQQAAQAPVPEGGPGGKYLARAVDFNIAKIREDIGKDLEDGISLNVETKSDRPGFDPSAFFPPGRF